VVSSLQKYVYWHVAEVWIQRRCSVFVFLMAICAIFHAIGGELMAEMGCCAQG
jgi:hypothetical protein